MARQGNDEHGVGASELELLTSTTLEKVEVVEVCATAWIRSVLIDVLALVYLDC